MAQKRYSKKKLAFFKKHIEAKLKNLTNDLDDSRGILESSSNDSASQHRIQFTVCIWPTLVLTHTREKKDTIS